MRCCMQKCYDNQICKKKWLESNFRRKFYFFSKTICVGILKFNICEKRKTFTNYRVILIVYMAMHDHVIFLPYRKFKVLEFRLRAFIIFSKVYDIFVILYLYQFEIFTQNIVVWWRQDFYKPFTEIEMEKKWKINSPKFSCFSEDICFRFVWFFNSLSLLKL